MKITAANLSNSEQFKIFLDGSIRKTIDLNTACLGLGTYLPGWRWSTHVGAQSGKPSENHIGYILSGHMIVEDSEGNEVLMEPGDGFEVAPGHDAWVEGDEPCLALDFTNLNEQK